MVEHKVNGLLVEPMDILALQETLRELLDNPDLRGRLSEGSRRSVQRFKASNMLRKTLALYRTTVHD